MIISFKSILAGGLLSALLILPGCSNNVPAGSESEKSVEDVRFKDLSPRFEKIKKIKMLEGRSLVGYVIRDKKMPTQCYLMTFYDRSSSLMPVSCDF